MVRRLGRRVPGARAGPAVRLGLHRRAATIAVIVPALCRACAGDAQPACGSGQSHHALQSDPDRAVFRGGRLAHRRTGSTAARAYSSATPPALITLAHLSVSAATTLPKSSGVPGISMPPRSNRRALIFGSARPALISLLSLSMISPGVPLGTLMPKKALAS